MNFVNSANSVFKKVNLLELELFVRAGKLRSIRALSRSLDLKPAYLSKVMMRLEKKLGVPLFKRSSSGILLTREGVELVKTAESILELSLHLRKGPQADHSMSERIWSVGAISFICSCFLSECIAQISCSQKNTRFRLVEFTHNELVSHGLKGAFEMAVHIGELEWTRSWISAEIGSMRWGLYARRTHPLAQSTLEKEVIKFPFIVPTDWTHQGFSIGEDYCPLPWDQRIKGDEVATAETALELVSFTQQLTFVPELVAKRLVNARRVREIRVKNWPLVEKKIHLSGRSDLIPSRFWKQLSTVMKARLSQ